MVLDSTDTCTQGPHTNVRRGPFLVREARIFLPVAVHFSPKKVDDLFLVVVVTFKRTLNVQTSKQCGKNLAADQQGPPPMVQPAQWIIRPCMHVIYF